MQRLSGKYVTRKQETWQIMFPDAKQGVLFTSI